MSIFDAFSFKKEGQKVLSREFFVELFQTAREAIIDVAKENIPGVDKKQKVDTIVIATIYSRTREVKNKLVLWLIDKIIDIVPDITQVIYDFLKEKIENL